MELNTVPTPHQATLNKILSLLVRAGHTAKIVGDSIHVTHESDKQFVGLSIAGAAIQLRINLDVKRANPPTKIMGGKCDIKITIK